MKILVSCLAGLALGATAFWMRPGPGAETAEAKLLDGKGEMIGHATFTQLPQGVRIKVVVSGLPPGIHAMHIYSGGDCHGPDFKSAGLHFNPYGKRHGAQNRDGPHAGDLPNFEVREDGTAQVEVTSLQVTLGKGRNSLLSSGRTCLVIHGDADDEVTDPTGNAGARIACGIIVKP
jgi:Cu-Zn family superoxide dismutase